MGNLVGSISTGFDEDVASTYDGESDDVDGSFAFSNIEFSSHHSHGKYDCILVFDEGSISKQWKYSQYETIQYDYLNLLDADDIEDRKNRFPHHGADWAMNGESNITIHDFNENERKLVIKALKKLNIKCKAIKSLNKRADVTSKYKYYYVGISEEIGRKWAHEIGYNLELEPDAAVKFLCLNNESLAKATVDYDDITKSAVKYDFWEDVYVKYDINVAPQIYKEFYGMYCYDKPSLFTARDRITLINDLITQDVEVGGAGIYIPKLQSINNNHCIADFFPVHTLEHLEVILNKLFSLKNICKCRKIFDLPLKEFRSYFGEYFAIYFAFLQYLTWYFVPLVIVGLIFGFMQILYNQVLIAYIWVLSLIVIIWAILFPIFWKKKEMKYAKKWGTLRFSAAAGPNAAADTNNSEESERCRPEFVGEYRTSIIDGKEEEFFDPTIRNARKCIACSIVLTFFIALIGSITAIILLRIYMARQTTTYGNYIIAAANTIVIIFFNNIYGLIAEKLNSWENYKTETEYENNLIIKIFIFRFINSYASLYYIAFFRIYEYESSPLYCTAEQCMSDLRIQLAFIFISQIVINNIMELLPLFIKRCLSVSVSRKGLNSKASFFTGDQADFIYNQYASVKYGTTFDDYCELIIAFGYSTLFIVSFPFAPLFAFLGYIVEARVDGYKLCKLSRRPWPRQCKNIGSWQLALEVMAWSVLITNIFIICITTGIFDILPHYTLNQNIYFQEVLTAMILVLCLILLIVFLNGCIGGKSYDIYNHIHRQTHIENKIIEIGNNIDKYIDSIISSNDNDLYGWEKWDVDKVAIFLHKVLFKNTDEFNRLKNVLKNVKFDGAAFAKCDKYYLEQYLHLYDNDQDSYFIKKFILNAKKQLIEHQQLAQQQNTIVASVFLMDDGQDSEHSLFNHQESEQSEQSDNENVEGEEEYNYKPKTFNFGYQNLYGMSVFFKNELKNQSKRKLWSRIEKDMIDTIQKHELDLFLYLTIIVYIKAKYKNEKLPRFSDKKFRNSTLHPLKNWLLECKISSPGLTLQQFNTYYPMWIREFYFYFKKNENEFSLNQNEALKHHHHHHHRHHHKRLKSKLEKHQFLIPITENNDSNSDEKYELSSENSIDYEIRTKMWSKECSEWFNKMNQISKFINKTLESTRIKIWDKFDKDNKQKLDTTKYLTKLIFYFIVLSIKSKSKKSKIPKYKQLQKLMKYFANDIIKMLPMKQKLYLRKYHFLTNIHIYFNKIVEKRSKLVNTHVHM